VGADSPAFQNDIYDGSSAHLLAPLNCKRPAFDVDDGVKVRMPTGA
jgi:hypothetical protein